MAHLPQLTKQNNHRGCSFLLLFLVFLIPSANTCCVNFEQYHEGVRAMWLAEKGGQVYKHPYDIGAYENLTLVK